MLKNTTVQSIYQKRKIKIIDDNHIAKYTPEEIKNHILNIGYINDNSLIKVLYKNEVKLFKMTTFVNSFIILLIATAIFKTIKYRQKQKQILSVE